jgi:hypothetical protein
MAKIQPAVLSIKFTVGEGVTRFLDLSQAACIVNRRFYRQGLNWVVAGFTVGTGPIGAGLSGDVTISKIPNTWVASNAWHKAYAHWKAQQDDALKEAGAMSARAKYRDFKIHASPLHVTTTFGTNLIPKDATGAQYLQGEWDASLIVIPNVLPDASGSTVDPIEFVLHMVGENVNAASTSRGIISGYAHSRAFPHSPDPVTPFVHNDDNWFQAMNDVGNDNLEIIQNATDRNDDLPYHQVDYPGGELNAPTLEIVHQQTFVPSTSSTSRKLGGTNVPCGLLEIINGVPSAIELFVHLVPGPSRGYLTQVMQDM